MTKNYNIVESFICKAKGYAKLNDCLCSNCEMAAKRRSLKKNPSVYFVLNENIVASNIFEAKKQPLRLGTIVKNVKKVDNNKIGVSIYNGNKPSLNTIWVCPLASLIEIPSKALISLILPVPSQNRIEILRDPDLCKDLDSLELGDLVHVFPYEGHTPPEAVIKFKGSVSPTRDGTFFGLELLDKYPEAQSDGSYHGEKLFSCPNNNGLIVTANRIRIKSASPMPCNAGPSVLELKNKFESMSSTSNPPQKIKEKSHPSQSMVSTLDHSDLFDFSDNFSDLCLETCQVNEENNRKAQLSCSKYSNGLISKKLPNNSYSSTPPTREYVFENTQDSRYLNAIVTDSQIDNIRPPSTGMISINTTPSSSLSSNFEDNHLAAYSPTFSNGDSSELGVDSLVEVFAYDRHYYGVIRWTGYLYPQNERDGLVAGIEMEEEDSRFCDGTFKNQRFFNCNRFRGHFTPLSKCRKDPRFIESHAGPSQISSGKEWGGKECPIIPGAVEPLSKEKDIETLCGKFHGIQGHHNSCYLDATLFVMFTFTSVFDSLLFRPATEEDSADYLEVQTVLREEIVNPLRTNLFVRADRVMKLRRLLEKLSSVTGLTSEEKDPEEFLTSLVAQILRAEPFLKLSSGQEAYHYQLFVEKDEKLTFPSVQQLFEQSFFTSDIKLKEIPSCLIIQMPRFGKSYKMYPRILPSQLLDITDVIENSPRQCIVCGKIAEFECKLCIDQCDIGLQSISYCGACLHTSHTHEKRMDHKPCWKRLEVPDYFKFDQNGAVPRLYMELFAVVCIETSHYVAFVKCGSGADAPWCFFDSMADRKGEQNGYNIPEMVPCPELPYWLSDKGFENLNNIRDERQLPERAKRLMCDAYMVMYQSSDVMMYR